MYSLSEVCIVVLFHKITKVERKKKIEAELGMRKKPSLLNVSYELVTNTGGKTVFNDKQRLNLISSIK